MWMPLQLAALTVRAGGVVAYPTEAVYGLGCDPLNRDAVLRLLAIKGRDMDKGLILFAADVEQLRPWIDVTPVQLREMERHWPGAVTYLVPASPRVPLWVRGRHATVAVRVGDHPLARELARRSGTPLVSTSANLSGRPPARNVFQVWRHLGDRVDFILTGRCDRAARPSRIIDLASGRILRS